MKATRKCSFCGKSFVTRSGMQRYCSEACQAEAKRARVMQKNNLFKVAQPLICLLYTSDAADDVYQV